MIQRLLGRYRKARHMRAVVNSGASIGQNIRVNGRCTISGGKNVVIGSNVHFNGIAIHGAGGVTIGDNFHSGSGCRIITTNHDYDNGSSLPYGKEVVMKSVEIGDNVWLGKGVLVLPGCIFGEGAIIGARAVVAGTVEPLGVAVGNPARVVKHRNAEHYERLKREERFL